MSPQPCEVSTSVFPPVPTTTSDSPLQPQPTQTQSQVTSQVQPTSVTTPPTGVYCFMWLNFHAITISEVCLLGPNVCMKSSILEKSGQGSCAMIKTALKRNRVIYRDVLQFLLYPIL